MLVAGNAFLGRVSNLTGASIQKLAAAGFGKVVIFCGAENVSSSSLFHALEACDRLSLTFTSVPGVHQISCLRNYRRLSRSCACKIWLSSPSDPSLRSQSCWSQLQDHSRLASKQVLDASSRGGSSASQLCQLLQQLGLRQCLSHCAAANMQWQLLPVSFAKQVGPRTALLPLF